VQAETGFGMLSIMFLSIGVNFFYLFVNIIIVVRKRFLRWWWLERTWCRNKKETDQKPKKAALRKDESFQKGLTANSLIIDLKTKQFERTGTKASLSKFESAPKF